MKTGPSTQAEETKSDPSFVWAQNFFSGQVHQIITKPEAHVVGENNYFGLIVLTPDTPNPSSHLQRGLNGYNLQPWK